MGTPTRVSHHLLQAQTIHNEVRAQRDEAIICLQRMLESYPYEPRPSGEPGSPPRQEQERRQDLQARAQKIIGRTIAYNRAEGETAL